MVARGGFLTPITYSHLRRPIGKPSYLLVLEVACAGHEHADA